MLNYVCNSEIVKIILDLWDTYGLICKYVLIVLNVKKIVFTYRNVCIKNWVSPI